MEWGIVMVGTSKTRKAVGLSPAERRYLEIGLTQPGGKLPIFDQNGQEINPATIRACLKKGYAERWFANPMMPNWMVCRLTDLGRDLLGGK